MRGGRVWTWVNCRARQWGIPRIPKPPGSRPRPQQCHFYWRPGLKEPRFVALENIIVDRKLSFGARTLYTWLHILAKKEGSFCADQQTLADSLGMSRQHLVKCMRDLREAKHVFVDRGQRQSFYRLAWAPPDVNKLPLRKTSNTSSVVASVVESGLQQDGDIRDKVLKTKRNTERYTRCACGKALDYKLIDRCWGCDRIHDPASAWVILDAVEFVREEIWGYVDCWHREGGAGAISRGVLPAPPDDGLCEQILDVICGDLAFLSRAMKSLHRDTAKRPSRSYGWFIAVLRPKEAARKTA